jgi:hypothetical protein
MYDVFDRSPRHVCKTSSFCSCMRVFLGPRDILQQVADNGSRELSGEWWFRTRGQLGAEVVDCFQSPTSSQATVLTCNLVQVRRGPAATTRRFETTCRRFGYLCTYKSALFLVLSVSCRPASILLLLIGSEEVEDDVALDLCIWWHKQYRSLLYDRRFSYQLLTNTFRVLSPKAISGYCNGPRARAISSA